MKVKKSQKSGLTVPRSYNPHSAGTYLGLRSIFWSLARAKTDDDLRDVASRPW